MGRLPTAILLGGSKGSLIMSSCLIFTDLLHDCPDDVAAQREIAMLSTVRSPD